MVAALGIGNDGTKTVLGLRQAATGNATVVGQLLGDLMERGLDFSQPRLYVHQHADSALPGAQRRNVLDQSTRRSGRWWRAS